MSLKQLNNRTDTGLRKKEQMILITRGDFSLLLLLGWVLGASMVAAYVFRELPVYIVFIGNTITVAICSYKTWKKGSKEGDPMK